jgi:predicted transglutaminase-like protease
MDNGENIENARYVMNGDTADFINQKKNRNTSTKRIMNIIFAYMLFCLHIVFFFVFLCLHIILFTLLFFRVSMFTYYRNTKKKHKEITM